MSKTVIAVACAFLFVASCEEGWLTDCQLCSSAGVPKVNLKIYIRNPEYIPDNPLITIYDGAVEDSIVLDRYTMDDPYALTTYYNAMLYKDYSATVQFFLDGKKYIMVGAACPQLKYDETSCDEPCWYVYNNVIDLRLRYR